MPASPKPLLRFHVCSVKWKTVPSQPELPTLKPRGPAGLSGPSCHVTWGLLGNTGSLCQPASTPGFAPWPWGASGLAGTTNTHMRYASIAHQAGPSDRQQDGVLLAFRAWKPQWPPVEGPVHPTVPQPPCWTSTFFPLSSTAVSSCNYSLTFLPTVIPKPVSSYFPKAPLKSTFSTFQIGRDREKMHVFLPRLRLNCCFCRRHPWTPDPLRPQDFRGAN